jgi:hypothetical protein
LGDFPRDTGASQIPAKFPKLPFLCDWNFHGKRLHKKTCWRYAITGRII